MKMLKVLAVAALASSTTLAMADEKVVTEDGIATFSTFKPAQVRAEVGTTGYGGAISWSPNPYVGVTLGYNGGDISWSDDVSVNGTKYDLDMDNSTAYLNAEIRPFANWFYVAAGVGYLDNEYEVTQKSGTSGSVRVNGTTFTPAAGQTLSVDGKIKQDKEFAPYLGLGVSPSITSRFGLFGEVGAYYTGNPTVNLVANGIASTPGFADAVQADEDKLRNDDKYKWAPVAKVGASFRF